MRHIERNAVLLFLVPACSEDPQHEYEVLLSELEKYNPQLLSKARILAVSKSDTMPEEDVRKIVANLSDAYDVPVVAFSSVSGQGVSELKDILWDELSKEQNQVIEISHSPLDIERVEREEPEAANDQEEGEHTIYLNEVEEDWDLSKYEGIGWDTQSEN